MPLSVLVYHSRAVHPFPRQDLLALTRAAQARNRSEGVTGLVLFDKAHFFQWLEGPRDGLDRVMRSIGADGRHTDIRVLTHRAASHRSFSDWNMKLCLPDSPDFGVKGEVLRLPSDAAAALRRSPDAAADWLSRLAPPPVESFTTAGLLESVIRGCVLPEILARHASRPTPRIAEHPRAPELAALLLRDDTEAAETLLSDVAARHGTALIRETLLEPAARLVGDRWGEDTCTDFDVTLALWRLDTALRLLPEGPAARPRAAARSVLVCPLPGEPHLVGASLAGASLRRAGWDVTLEGPADHAALGRLVEERRFDAVDLSLSPALARTHRLPALARAVALVRRVSRDPAITVAVGGRVFSDGSAAPADVGADLASGALGRRS